MAPEYSIIGGHTIITSRLEGDTQSSYNKATKAANEATRYIGAKQYGRAISALENVLGLDNATIFVSAAENGINGSRVVFNLKRGETHVTEIDIPQKKG